MEASMHSKKPAAMVWDKSKKRKGGKKGKNAKKTTSSNHAGQQNPGKVSRTAYDDEMIEHLSGKFLVHLPNSLV